MMLSSSRAKQKRTPGSSDGNFFSTDSYVQSARCDKLLLTSGGQTTMTKSKHALPYQLSLPLPTQRRTTIDNVHHPVVGSRHIPLEV
jgi:hypothetical protein